MTQQRPGAGPAPLAATPVPTDAGGQAVPVHGRTATFTLPGGAQPPHLWGIRCSACGVVSFPAVRFCSNCASRSVERIALSRAGVLQVWSTVYQDPGPSFFGERPYTVVVVSLAEGVQVTGTLAPGVPPEQLHPGLALELEVVALRGTADPPLYDFRFRPAAG